MKKNFTLVLTLMMVLALVAYGGEAAVPPVVGAYVFDSMETMGMSINAEALSGLGMDLRDFALEIKADGTFSMTLMGDSESGTWKLSGATVTMTVKGDKVEAKFDGSKLTLSTEEQGVAASIVFVKTSQGQAVAKDSIVPTTAKATPSVADLTFDTTVLLLKAQFKSMSSDQMAYTVDTEGHTIVITIVTTQDGVKMTDDIKDIFKQQFDKMNDSLDAQFEPAVSMLKSAGISDLVLRVIATVNGVEVFNKEYK